MELLKAVGRLRWVMRPAGMQLKQVDDNDGLF